jgi:superfamily I DNA/RNA helicase
MTPSKQQQDIYDWVKNGSGNLIIKARAGSGKTTTAVNAIQFMKGTVLAMAFNTKASYQLTERLKTMACPNATASTVHSAGKGLLYKAFGWHKVNADKVYYLTDKYCQSEELRITRNFIKQLVSFAKQNAFGVKGQTDIDDTKAWMDIVQHHDIDMNFEADLYTVIEIAKDVLRDSNAITKEIDFDDMQYLPLVYGIIGTQYDWVIIDEAQDTNVCRKLLIKTLLKPNGRLIVIGDEGQAIYGFTGAENDSMNLIKDMFNCSELPLSICYRCGKNIITEAQKFFSDIMAFENAPEGSITSMKYQAFVDGAINMNLSRKDGIVCRNNAPNVALAFALIRQGIGCRIEGKDIGNDLKKLVRKWKRVANLDEFTNKLLDFFNKEFNKATYAKLQLLEDKMDTMIILIERCQSLGQNDLGSLENLITSMFTDTKDGNVPDIVTFSSIHKAKGLEWERVFWVGDAQFSPSKYAIRDWQLEQEKNLQYVACTRAMSELIHVVDCPARRGANNE